MQLIRVLSVLNLLLELVVPLELRSEGIWVLVKAILADGAALASSF